jgi:hypothetical protein
MSLLNKIFKDQIYCISCLHRPDRYFSSLNVFENMDDMPTLVKYHRPVKDSRGGIYGCHDEHRSCLKEFWDSGEEYALITEDDLEQTKDWKKRLLDVLPLITSNQYEIIHLTNKGVIKSNDNGIWYRGVGLRTLCYVVSRQYLERFNGLIPSANGEHIDVEMFLNHKSEIFAKKTYFIHKPIFTIKPFKSDIRTGFYGKLEQLIGEEKLDNIIIWIVRLVYEVLKFFKREDLFEIWGLKIVKLIG